MAAEWAKNKESKSPPVTFRNRPIGGGLLHSMSGAETDRRKCFLQPNNALNSWGNI